jgi:hypothetical protein
MFWQFFLNYPVPHLVKICSWKTEVLTDSWKNRETEGQSEFNMRSAVLPKGLNTYLEIGNIVFVPILEPGSSASNTHGSFFLFLSFRKNLFKCILLEMLVIINFDYCYCPYLKRS